MKLLKLVPEKTNIQFINKRLIKAKKKKPTQQRYPTLFATAAKNSPRAAQRTIRPPKWLGWAFLSAGAVLVLQSFAMPKPGT